MIHEFGWGREDWDRLAAGTIAGHIIECGPQCTGGNFTRWWEVPELWNVGYPIVEASADGSFVVTKHPGTGGMVTVDTVAEQLVYEMGDPSEYVTPDVVADFTTIRLDQEGPDRVRVSGIRGRPKTPFYKVSASYLAGYKASAQITLCGPRAVDKARLAAECVWKRLERAGLDLRRRPALAGGAGDRRLPAGYLRRPRRRCPRWCCGSACATPTAPRWSASARRSRRWSPPDRRG